MQSRNGKPVTMPSECRVQYAPEGLYLAFTVKNSDELKDIGKLERDRSLYLHDDCIELFIQPSPSGAYGHFCFDYEGNQFDEPEAEGGFMWNLDWRIATRRNADGWTASGNRAGKDWSASAHSRYDMARQHCPCQQQARRDRGLDAGRGKLPQLPVFW